MRCWPRTSSTRTTPTAPPGSIATGAVPCASRVRSRRVVRRPDRLEADDMMSAMAATAAEDLGLLLSLASHGLATRMSAAFDGVGLSPRAHCVLSKAVGEELTQGRLAELAGLDKTTMVATIDELERAGLAARRPSPADRRARVIAVTPEGEEMVARGREVVARVQAEILGDLPHEQREAFVTALAQLVDGGLGTPVECEHVVRRRSEVPN